MEVKGKINSILPVASGVSKAGNEWKKQEFVIDVEDGQYPKQICFTIFNDKLSLIDGLKEGTEVNVSFSVESREFNGKWYHNVNAWKLETISPELQGDYPPPFNIDDVPPEPMGDNNDLPF